MNAGAQTFLADAGWRNATRHALAGDASARRYERLHDGGNSAILMIAPPQDDASFDAFLRMADWLSENGFSAPQIFHSDRESGLMLMEDFGDALFTRLAGASDAIQARIYSVATDLLQSLAALTPPAFLAPLGPFELTDLTLLAFEEAPRRPTPGLKAAFRDALRTVLATHIGPPAHVSLRDFHAGNLIWLTDRAGSSRIGLLDFQDAVAAPLGYDLASLIDDPRCEVPRDLRADLIAQFAAATGMETAELTSQIDLLSLARNLRILGIFRRAARLRSDPAYLGFLPRTMALIDRAAETPAAAAMRPMIAEILACYATPVPS